MAEFIKIKTEVEEAKELEDEIKTFLKEIDLIIKVAKNIPATNYIKFDPFLFMMWRNVYRRK